MEILKLRAKCRTLQDDSGFMLNFGDSHPSAEHLGKSVDTVSTAHAGIEQENGRTKFSNDAMLLKEDTLPVTI